MLLLLVEGHRKMLTDFVVLIEIASVMGIWQNK
jgi:hypothetical protein